MNEYEISLWEDALVDGVVEPVYKVQTVTGAGGKSAYVQVISLDTYPQFAGDPTKAQNSEYKTYIPAKGDGSTALYIFASQIEPILYKANHGISSGICDPIQFVLEANNNSVRYSTCWGKKWVVEGDNVVFYHEPPSAATDYAGTTQYFKIAKNATTSYTAKRFANYYDEFKIGVIGSNTMDAICHAEEPKLIEKLNGTHTFSFKMRYVYNENGQTFQNPWLNLLVNERKIKVKWNNQWYDFLIKGCDENSDGKSIMYTCEDQFITELSKNGFNIELSQELANNQGTVTELVERVLDGTNWSLGEVDIIPEEIEEPVYEVNTAAASNASLWVGRDLYDNVDIDTWATPTSGTQTIAANKKILVYYNQVQDLINSSATSGTCLLEILYDENGNYQTENFTSQLVINGTRLVTANKRRWTYTDNTFKLYAKESGSGNSVILNIPINNGVSEQYRAKKTISSAKTAYDPLTKHYVTLYEVSQPSDRVEVSGSLKAVKNSKNVPYESGYHYHYFTSSESSGSVGHDFTVSSANETFSLEGAFIRQVAAATISASRTAYRVTAKCNSMAVLLDSAPNYLVDGPNTATSDSYPINKNDEIYIFKDEIDNISVGEYARIQFGRIDDSVFHNYRAMRVKVCEAVDSSHILLTNNGYTFAEFDPSDTNIQIAKPKIVLNTAPSMDVQNFTWYYDRTTNKPYINDDIVYEYTETEYNEPDTVMNILANNKDFSNTYGWLGDNVVGWEQLPTIDNWLATDSHALIDYPGKSYLKVLEDSYVYNNGILASGENFKGGFVKGEKYILRIKPYMLNTSTPSSAPQPLNLESWVSQTNPKKLKTIITGDDGTVYFTSNTNSPSLHGTPHQQDDLTRDEWDWWIEYTLTCQVSASQKTIAKNFPKVGFLYNDFSGKKTSLLLIENVQLFKKIVDSSNNIIYPGNLNSDSVIIQKYKYYNHSYCERQKITNADDITYLHDDVTKYTGTSPTLTPLYNEGNQKIRAISVKESNRFNILQTIAETFECWLEFKVDHDSTGKIIGNKRVNILKDIGEDVGYGFIYGIDLKSITRKIQSDQIVTKTIVKANSNEFAKNGFCTIARSVQNYPKAEFILDFGYYTSHGLLGQNQLNRDLYLTTGLAYFYKLRVLNTRLDEIAEMIPDLYLEQDQLNALITTHTNLITSAQEEVIAAKAEICQLAGTSSYTAQKTQNYIKNNAKMPTIIENLAVINNATSVIKSSTAIKNAGMNRLTSIDSQIQLLEDEYQAKVDEKQALDNTFYQKYARFLQEGSWVSEDYIDDELYYLDARSVAYTSSRPKVSYTINVIRVSSLEEFKNKVFKIGDIGFVQDTEFFGYTTIDGIQTPYKEKILISEMAFNFEEPDKDTITVQNYKTQFDDLFQRITATTQSLQYASGEYALAAAQVQAGGGLTQEAIQTTLDLNTNLVYSALNQTIIQDSTGITVADQTNKNNMTKITSGGVFITTDGGVTWKNAIRGDGVATQWLSAGSVNTNKITILDGTSPAFRWDSQGINAFSSDEEGVHLETFVRFDKYGVYGINNYTSGSEPGNFIPASESDIWDEAAFGMTWDGFFMKNKRGSHRVEISSTDDIQVVTNDVPVVKIGLIKSAASSSEEDLYGICLRDADGNAVLETGNDGNLWLKNILSIGEGAEGEDPLVTIGRGESKDNTYEVFNANDQFIIYADGSFIAKTGTIGQFDVTDGGLSYSDAETDSSLSFDPSGLTIIDAPFYIKTYNDDDVLIDLLSFDNGTLTLTNMIANDITVNSGLIGGFHISEGQLVSVASTDDNDPQPLIILNGQDGNIIAIGEITAENLKIGTGAVINDYIQLGEHAYLCNPDIEEDNLKRQSVIKITNNNNATIINLKSDGTMSFGTDSGVYIDGTRPAIVCGDTVEITPTLSKFTNVNVSGKLMTTIFEVNKTQVVGGSMVFKPSYKIKNVTITNNVTSIELEDAISDSYTGYYVVFINDNGNLQDTIYQIATIDQKLKLITINTTVATEQDETLYGIIIIGEFTESIPTSVSVGINSGDNSNDFLEARGVVVKELSLNDGVLQSKTRTFLGDLGGVNSSFPAFGGDLKGYGLVGDNVYLQGSLTTIVPTDTEAPHTYAGINTVSNIKSSQFGTESSPEYIVFWGGAGKTDEGINIAEAPFQVTDKGSIYARDGIFEGALLSKTRITGAKIYTAEIHGWNTNQSGSLKFYNLHNEGDLQAGLIFNTCDSYDENDEPQNSSTVFKIDNNGFTLGSTGNAFIAIESTSIDFNGSTFNTTSGLTIGGLTIGKDNIITSYGQNQITNSINDITEFQVKENQVTFGENNMRYVSVFSSDTKIGYDLYINEGSSGQDSNSSGTTLHNGHDLSDFTFGALDDPIEPINPGTGITA